MPTTNTTWRVLDVVTSLLLTIVTALVTWNLRTTVSHGEVIAELRARQFTVDDGLRAWEEIAAIREMIAGLPPDKFVQRVDDLEARIRELERRVP